MTLMCGANVIQAETETVGGKTLEEVRGMFGEMLNASPQHTALVDGEKVNATEYRITGKEEEIEFFKEAGQKG